MPILRINALPEKGKVKCHSCKGIIDTEKYRVVGDSTDDYIVCPCADCLGLVCESILKKHGPTEITVVDREF